MAVKFGDLYDALLDYERSIEKIKRDISSSECDSVTKCRLERELNRIETAYENLLDSSIDFTKLNFDEVIYAINDCMECIDIETINPMPH